MAIVHLDAMFDSILILIGYGWINDISLFLIFFLHFLSYQTGLPVLSMNMKGGTARRFKILFLNF